MLSQKAREYLVVGLANKSVGNEIADAIDAGGNNQAAYVANVSNATLTGVDGTGSNAAPLTGTQSQLNALGNKVNAILAALIAAGLMKSS